MAVRTREQASGSQIRLPNRNSIRIPEFQYFSSNSRGITTMSREQLQQLLIEWIKANKRTSTDIEITPETELLGSGLLDSFGFLDLIVYIESNTGFQIDLADA